MFSTENDVRDLSEARLKEAYEELGKLNYSDDQRRKVLDEVKILADIDSQMAQNEEQRLNNNAKNSIEEEKLVIEKMKLENDRARMKFDIGKVFVYTLGGIGMQFSSYLLDTWFQKIPACQRFSEKLHDMIVRK